MAHVRFRRASSCLSKTSGGALACRSVSKLCLSNPPIRLNSAMVFKSVWAAILPPKKRRRIYSDRDNPAISACSVRRVFSSTVTRRVIRILAACRLPSCLFCLSCLLPLECEKRSAEHFGSPEGVAFWQDGSCVLQLPSCHEEPASCSGQIVYMKKFSVYWRHFSTRRKCCGQKRNYPPSTNRTGKETASGFAGERRQKNTPGGGGTTGEGFQKGEGERL